METQSKTIDKYIPTLPGWRHWYDVYYYAGWRIQKNEVNNKFRTISPTKKKWVYDTEQRCMEKINERKERGLKPKNEHLVIIVPGLNNLLSTFSSIEKGLKNRGYDTLLWNFASNRATTVEHAQRLFNLIDRLEDTKKISFVSHSLGGLILRTMFAHQNDFNKKFDLGNVVMIAPPHAGSFVADLVKDQLKLEGLFQWVCGGVGHDLTTKGANDLPELTVPVGIIVGGTGNTVGVNPIAGIDNDIVVSTSSSLVDMAVDVIQVKGTHTLMLWDKNTVYQTISFLENGTFKH